jgi:hypothetical protein
MLDISQIADQRYIPTSVEIKRVLLMYLLVGIMIQLAKSQLTVYEYQHLKQSLGWSVMIILTAIITAPLWFIPYGPMIIALVWLAWVWYVSRLVYRAFQWHYPQQWFLTSVGTWILGIFDHQVTVTNT